MNQAWKLASRIWTPYSDPMSRHDFTRPQLFACLIVREMLKLSYRKTEKLLRDAPDWLGDIEMSKAPDHNTLWRAFGELIEARKANRMLDLLAELFADAGLLDLACKPLTIDSTCYEPRHRSRHYDRVCQKMKPGEGGKYAEKQAKNVNRSRSLKARRMPRLALAVASNCHLILAARTHIGSGSDHPDFDPLLHRSWQRAAVKAVVADAGFDSEKNHMIARYEMNVRSIIPPKIGRPTGKPAQGHYRRVMQTRFARKADKRMYGQRAQSETVNSMMKRNFSDALRSILPKRRKKEMLLRSLAHDIMLWSGKT